MDESNIQDYSSIKTPAYTPVEPTSVQPVGKKQKGDAGASTIEQSEEMAALLIPSMNAPILALPSGEAFKMSGSLIAALGNTQISDISTDIWKKYNENWRQISEQVAQQINSPAYIAMQEIRIHGDSANVSGVETAKAANAAQAHPTASSFNIVSAVDNLSHTWSKVAPTEKSNSDVTTLIPMTATVFIGGALAIAGMEMSVSATGSSNILQGSMDIIGKLQQTLPALNVQDVVPMINLMVMAPIYYNALNEATSRLPNNEAQSNVKASQEFAKSVIAMTSNPDYIMANFVNKMDGADQMSPERKQQVATAIRLILATVSLSLLYSVETGKVQGEEFWGIDPQELRDMLNGTIPGPDPSSQPTDQSKLSATLINIIQAQLAALPGAQRLSTVEAILNFVSSNQSVKTMLDPQKVVSGVLSSMDFDAESKTVDKEKV